MVRMARAHILFRVVISMGLTFQIPAAYSQVTDPLQPYAGPSEAPPSNGMSGKVFCGYQGWFNTPDDGARRGWRHFGRGGRFEPGNCTIDLWPDVSELDADERIDTTFRHQDGSVAQVFSSYHRKTVLRHFQWMQEFGIDGVFVQRFATEVMHPDGRHHFTTVLSHCREGANRSGRLYAVMYDLSGLGRGQMKTVIEDWTQLVRRMRIGRDPSDRAYLYENGKPIVGVWGIGFNDGRQYDLDECAELLRFLKEDPEVGGCAIMLGVPTGWRTLDRDAVRDDKLLAVINLADIISPWAVGRYESPEGAARHARQNWVPDIEWCEQHQKRYMPVVFPGFSWHNLRPGSPLNQIPRLQGRFLWAQYLEAKRAGATMVYQAMFDELDEGTAIFKCTNSPPVGKSPFVTYEGLPTDHYLWLTGMGSRLLRSEIGLSPELPARTR